jgi:hypothetical protein
VALFYFFKKCFIKEKINLKTPQKIKEKTKQNFEKFPKVDKQEGAPIVPSAVIRGSHEFASDGSAASN